VPPGSEDVARALEALGHEIEACTRCGLHVTRTRSVPGEGHPDSDLMFVGEAPGYHEDQQGRPFVGQAGRLLDELLLSIGLDRERVFIANVLKSRPPNNRDPLPDEIEACKPYLWRQIELIRPKVICTLGNHATKLLTGDAAGITRVHGIPRVLEIGGEYRYLYPIFHPAAALYTRSMLATLQEDFRKLPGLLARPRPLPDGEEPQAEVAESMPVQPPHFAVNAPTRPSQGAVEGDSPGSTPPGGSGSEQLGLF
jgi:DNA polymerase